MNTQDYTAIYTKIFFPKCYCKRNYTKGACYENLPSDKLEQYIIYRSPKIHSKQSN